MNKVLLTFLLVTGLLFFFLLNISFGSIRIPFKDVISILIGGESSRETWQYIILHYRLPKAIVCILVGIALSVSGLLMQTLFRNPMAESYVLGISSGAGLGVAFLFLGSSFLPTTILNMFTSKYGVAFVAILGSFLLLFLILAVSVKVKNTVTILIVGLMFGSFSNAIISVLTYWSTAEELKRFTFWSMGSIGNVGYDTIRIFSLIVLMGLGGSLLLVRTLDALLLGDNYAQSMGVNIKRARNKIIIVTALLAGVSTAFVGPIAFIGLAVPHITRLLLKVSTHRTLIIWSSFIGATLMLCCDLLTQINGEAYLLPINAITSIFGAPIVIWLLLRNRI